MGRFILFFLVAAALIPSRIEDPRVREELEMVGISEGIELLGVATVNYALPPHTMFSGETCILVYDWDWMLGDGEGDLIRNLPVPIGESKKLNLGSGLYKTFTCTEGGFISQTEAHI